MNTVQRVIGDYPAFLSKLFQEMADEGFDMSDFAQMDHLCYRVTTREAYEAKKQEFLQIGTLLDEVAVAGRPIATYRLHVPIRYQNWRIDAIELPAPKEGSTYSEGLEHAEFVLFDDQADFLQKHAGKQFDLKAADRGINPEIGYKLPSCTVKFHLLSLTTAVYLQHKLGLTEI